MSKMSRTLSGTLTCSVCDSQAFEKVEDTGIDETLYRCKKCGHRVRYQYRNKPKEDDNNVYKNFTRGLRQIFKK